MKDVIERLRKLEADTSDCFPEVMTLVAGVRSNLPKLLNRLEKLEAVVEAAKALRASQCLYMAKRGDEILGKAVGKAAKELDDALEALEEDV